VSSALVHLEREYAHLYTVTGGKLVLIPGSGVLGRTPFFQVHVQAYWNGKRYGGAVRKDPELWLPNPDILARDLYYMLRELAGVLYQHGCEYAIRET
jgi:hypothetical protein